MVSSNYIRDIDFLNKITTILSNEAKTQIKIVHIDKLWKYGTL
jgi:hypothetical protein